MKNKTLLLAIASLGFGTAGITALCPQNADAADHAEAPGTQADPIADINDLYAWHTADSLVAIVTFNPLMAAASAAQYDGDVRYVVHIDNDGDIDNGAEVEIDVRFGQNTAGAWGVRAMGLPGGTAMLSGAVDSTISEGDYHLYAGQKDDPFFFDLAGFNSTLASDNADGSVDFSGFGGTPVDALAGLNTMAIVLEFPSAAVANGTNSLNIWATSSRAAAQ